MERVSRSTLTLRNDVRSVRVDLHEYADLCRLPCDAPLSSLGGVLGVSHDGGDPVPAGHVRGVLNAGDVLHVHFDDRNALRVAGWITAIGGALLGAVLIIVGLNTATPDALGVPQYPWELIGAGAGVVVLGLAVGIPLAFLNDAASVEIRESASQPSGFAAQSDVDEREDAVDLGAEAGGTDRLHGRASASVAEASRYVDDAAGRERDAVRRVA